MGGGASSNRQGARPLTAVAVGSRRAVNTELRRLMQADTGSGRFGQSTMRRLYNQAARIVGRRR